MAGFVVYLLRNVLVPFVVAFIFAYVLTPVVNRLEQRLRLPRAIVVLLVFLAFTLPVAFIIANHGATLMQNLGYLAENAPRAMARYVAQLFGGRQIWFLGQTIDAQSVANSLVAQIPAFLGTPRGMAQVGRTLIIIVMNGIFILVFLFYFLVGGKDLIRGALRLFPEDKSDRLKRLILKVDALIGRFLRGLAVVVVFSATVAWLGFTFIFHIRYAFLLALTIGFLELIPLFGPITSGFLTCFVALSLGDLIFTTKVVMFYLALRLTIDQAVGPVVLGKAVTLSPVVVIFAFLAGGTLFGFLGLLLAVPAAAVVRVILDDRRVD
jgi:predicted PurR-regulated permease PerM